MTPRPELREEVQEVLEQYTTRMGAVNVVGLADHLAATIIELRELEGMWKRLLSEPVIEAAAKAHYQAASAFSWERLSTTEQAVARTAAVAALVAARKMARYGTVGDPSEVGDSTRA